MVVRATLCSGAQPHAKTPAPRGNKLSGTVAQSCTRQNISLADCVLALGMTQLSCFQDQASVTVQPCAEQACQPAQKHLDELHSSDADTPSASYSHDPAWNGFKWHQPEQAELNLGHFCLLSPPRPQYPSSLRLSVPKTVPLPLPARCSSPCSTPLPTSELSSASQSHVSKTSDYTVDHLFSC